MLKKQTCHMKLVCNPSHWCIVHYAWTNATSDEPTTEAAAAATMHVICQWTLPKYDKQSRLLLF